MEEKERYEIDKSTNYHTNTIVDTKTNTYYGNVEEHIDLLNEQNKENQQLKEQLSNEEQSHDLCIKSFEEEIEKLRKQIKFESDVRERFKRENHQLKQQLAEKEKAIENWQTMYESVVQTCHNDKEEIERLNKQHRELTHQHEDKGE